MLAQSHHPKDLPQRVRTLEGVELRYRVQGAGPPLLIHNGLISSLFHWYFWVEHFQKTHAVVTWDYPGHGESPDPPSLQAIGIEPFAEQGHAVYEAAGLAGGAVVCGLSMGVQTALEHYARHPADVKALVLLCGTFGRPLNRFSRSPRLRSAVPKPRGA